VAPARAAGREAGRSAGHDRGSGGSGRAGHGRSREPAGGGGAARRGTRCGRAVGRGRWVAHRPTGPGGAGARRRDHRRARGAARELPARGAHTRDRPHGAGRLRRGRAAPQRERGRRGGGGRRRAPGCRAAVGVGRAGRGGGRGGAARARGGRRREPHRAGCGGRWHGGQASRGDRRAARRSARRSHRRPAPPGRRPSGHPDPRPRRPAGVTALPSGASATPTPPATQAVQALLDVYARVGPLFVGGEGAELIAEDGTRYLDFVAGIGIVAREDWADVDHAVSASRTAAVILEPVQGEGGVRPLDAEWLGFVRELCDSRGVAVIFDEVQCGLGRTGTLFAYEQAGVVPDILTLAKPLAGGLPMGAVLVTSAVAAALKPGDHATTFGGGPLVAGVALEVVRTIADPAFLADVRRKAEWLGAHLAQLAAGAPGVREVRGRGLMWGLELAEPAAPIVAAARERGLLVVTAGAQVCRLLPARVRPGPALWRGAS